MQPYAWRSMAVLEQMYRLMACVVGTMEVNKEGLLRRAKESFATVTELADTLVRTDRLSFRSSHRIVSRVVQKAVQSGLRADQISLELVNESARDTIGRELTLTAEELRLALDPVHFVQIRSLPGGPAPDEIKRAIEQRRTTLQADQNWLSNEKQVCQTAMDRLDQITAEWSVGP